MEEKNSDSVKHFLELCLNDKDLKTKVLESDEAGIIEEAKARGYDFSSEDFINSFANDSSERELDESELETVAGGGKAAVSGVSCGAICQTIRSLFSGESGCNPWVRNSGPANFKGPSLRRK